MDREKLFKRMMECGVLEMIEGSEILTEDIGEASKNADPLEGYSEEEIGVTASGVKYVKKVVNQYLMDRGYSFTPENVELAAKLAVAKDGVLQSKRVVKKWYHELQNADDEQIRDYMFMSLLEQTVAMNKVIASAVPMEYTVVTLPEKLTDAVNGFVIQRTLDEYSKNGWTLKSFVPNVYGMRAGAATLGGMLADKQHMALEQVMLIFEKPKGE